MHARTHPRRTADYQHYKKEDIVYLSDEAQDPRSHPTRANMLNAMRWLVQDAHPHDSLFFHCAYRAPLLPSPISLPFECADAAG